MLTMMAEISFCQPVKAGSNQVGTSKIEADTDQKRVCFKDENRLICFSLVGDRHEDKVIDDVGRCSRLWIGCDVRRKASTQSR